MGNTGFVGAHEQYRETRAALQEAIEDVEAARHLASPARCVRMLRHAVWLARGPVLAMNDSVVHRMWVLAGHLLYDAEKDADLLRYARTIVPSAYALYGPNSGRPGELLEKIRRARRRGARGGRGLARAERKFAEARQATGPGDLKVMRAGYKLHEAYVKANRVDDAVALHEQLADTVRRERGESDDQVLWMHRALTLLYIEIGEVEREVVARETEAAWIERYGSASPETDSARQAIHADLAESYCRGGRGVDAERLARRGLDLRVAHSEEDSRRAQQAWCYFQLGQALVLQEAFGRAAHAYQTVLDLLTHHPHAKDVVPVSECEASLVYAALARDGRL
jgi:hypothetical protein